MTKPKNILIIRLSAMGDVAMTVPVIRAFCHQFPEVKITVLTKEFFIPFFRGLHNVTVIHPDLSDKHKGVLGLFRLSRELNQWNFDGLLDLHNVLRSRILKTFLSINPSAQINKGRKEKRALVFGSSFHQLKTTHQRYADAFKELGYDVNLINPELPGPVKLNTKLKGFLKGTKNKRIGIAPFAAHKGKMYPLTLMNQVIQSLSKKHLVVLFGGGLKEVNQLKKIASNYKNVINTAGRLTLDEELDVISNLDLMLSMDSGNGHLAAMLGIDVITIWGVTHPYAGFLPFNQSITSALTLDKSRYPKVPTSVYGNKYPKEYEQAIGTISPETIISKIKERLDENVLHTSS